MAIEVVKNDAAELVLKLEDGTVHTYPKAVITTGETIITVTGGMDARCKNPKVRVVRGD